MAAQPMVARGAELTALERALAAEALPAALLLEGEAGIGKSTLWQAAVDLCAGRGDRVLASRPAEREAALAYAALGDLLAPLVDEVPLPPPQRRALDVALLRADPEGSPPDRLAVGRAVEALVSGLGEGVAIAVDDVQWLDAATASALEFTLRRVHGGVAAIVARRGGPDEPVPLALDRALPLTRIQVGPLSLGATQELIRMRLDATLPRPVLRRVHETSGGNPFFALELARLALTGADGFPATLKPVLRARLDRLPETARAALLTLALAGSVPAAPAFAPALATDVVIEEAGVIRFAHPLLAAAVADAAAPAQRREVHRRLADAAADPESRARHLLLAGVSDREAFDAGAAAASGRGLPAAAAELLEAAARTAPPGDAAWSRRLTAAAERWEEAGDFERGERLLHEVVARAPAGPDRAAALTQLAVLHPGATDLAERARAEAGDDDALLARIAFVGAGNLGFAGDFRAGREESAVAVGHAERSGDPKLLALSLTRLAFYSAATLAADPAPLLARAARLEREAPVPVYWEARGTEAAWSLWRDELDAARILLVAQLETTADTGDDSSRLGVLWNLADVELRAGDVPAAGAFAREGLAIAEGTGDVQSRAAMQHPLVLVLALESRPDEARTVSEEALAALGRIEDVFFPLYHRHARGALELLAGDPAAALPWLESVEAELVRFGIAEPGVVPYHADLLEALARCGRHEDASERAARLDGRRPRLAGIAARALGDAGAAVELHRESPHRLELGRSLLAVAAERRRERAFREARAALAEADALFAACGATAWRERTADELGRIPGRSGGGGLTPAEERVAALVAAGRTNREVAAELVVTLRTVETHLSHVYAKLGVRSRTELARLAAERSWVPTTRGDEPAA